MFQPFTDEHCPELHILCVKIAHPKILIRNRKIPPGKLIGERPHDVDWRQAGDTLVFFVLWPPELSHNRVVPVEHGAALVLRQ